jgi:aspartyl-tRNA(Asn)/glutamyl-tRNA(Gln) amidotransferase subunit A
MLGDYVAPYDATVITRLREAGAVIVGQTNLDEFAMGSSCERSAFHPTHNPWNPERVPGGSSGGSAAAVAASAVPLALGSDTGGSIRQPAAFCGVVGLKPTYGRVSRRGLVAFASSTDQVGPIARRVEDVALALPILAGHDPRDATSSRRPVADPVAGLEDGIEGLVVGVLEQVASADLPAPVLDDWQRSLDRLVELGAELRTVSVPSLDAAIACYYVLANCEASTNLARFDGVRYGHRARLEAGADLDQLYVKSRSEGFGPEVQRRILLGTFALSSGYYEAYYGRAQAVRRTLAHEHAVALREVDVIVSPTAPSGAFRIGENVDDPLQMYLSDIFTVPASLAGLPALSVPSGLDGEGLPLGLQVTGRPFDEATVLRVGRAFEKAVSLPEIADGIAAGAEAAAGEDSQA